MTGTQQPGRERPRPETISLGTAWVLASPHAESRSRHRVGCQAEDGEQVSPQDQVHCLLWSLRRVQGWKTTSEPRNEAERPPGLSWGSRHCTPGRSERRGGKPSKGLNAANCLARRCESQSVVEAAGLGPHTPSSDQELTSGPHAALQGTPDRPSHRGKPRHREGRKHTHGFTASGRTQNWRPRLAGSSDSDKYPSATTAGRGLTPSCSAGRRCEVTAASPIHEGKRTNERTNE